MKTKGLLMLGPAFVASIAYIDPGNFATNIQAGSKFGYKMLWVVVLANIMAMLIQNLSSKVGIATGKSIPQLSKEYFSKRINFIMWVSSEIAAMATDIAEFLGATLALNLLFGIPMILSGFITGIITFAILYLERFGLSVLEKAIACFAFTIGICYLIETFLSKPDFYQIAYHSVIPWVGGKDSLLLATGIIGATIMPHAIYLHSALSAEHAKREERKSLLYKQSIREVAVAMTLAGLVNIAMLYMSAEVFNGTGHQEVGDIQSAFKTLIPLLGAGGAYVFLFSLLFSGLSSSAVGTMAGQIIMEGFVSFSIPVWVRRIFTMIPAFIIIAMGIEPTNALIISQVVLSLVLPIPLVILVQFSKNEKLMGSFKNKKATTVVAIICTVFILLLNIILIFETLFG